ncbi:MAG: RagB/SusD family nutrient uptake outer membrane protein [Bacteroidales bacterium]|nr:RagB/SusD family nutrient uptake outer membrane protein [Bacteroidales bacterium]
MKQSIIFKTALVALSAVTMTACNDFLDTMPDNRTELDTKEKIQKLLVSAYPTIDPISIGEFMSDNVDDMGPKNPNYNRLLQQLFRWQDVTEDYFCCPDEFWTNLNMCVETANTALEAIEKSDDPSLLTAERAEALLCRAYADFLLVNYFALHYNPNDPERLGITCVKEPMTTIEVHYERETVLENYASIQADLEEALPLVRDDYYVVPKYHFTKMAANAFACQFYLFSEQWDKAKLYADYVLGSNPSSMIRNWKQLGSMDQDFDARSQYYVNADLNNNIMLLTSASLAGRLFGPTYLGKRYAHNAYIGTNETVAALAALWKGDKENFFFPISRYSGTNLDTWIMESLPDMFEYTDPVAGIGIPHTVYAAFSGDEVLLNRAEAKIMLGQYDAAAEDMNVWLGNVADSIVIRGLYFTPQDMKQFMDSIKYSYDDSLHLSSTIKKHLHPLFSIDAEGSIQESMLQLLLAMRRYETLHMGKRWLDIKRYGIVIPRRVMNASGKPEKVIDWLTVDDPRRAVQIPQNSISAGYEANPRVISGSDSESCEGLKEVSFESFLKNN